MKLATPTSATEAVIDAIAVARLTRLLQQDDVWPLPELRSVAMANAGDTRWADLVHCVWCLSVWVSCGVIVARHLFPREWPWVARALAGSAVAGHLAQLAE